MTDTPEFRPGVYFSMPEDQYHATPALSASGIKNLLISPLDYWHNCPWLNPDYKHTEADHFAFGHGADTFICEGEDAFNERFAPYLSKDDHPDALDGTSDLKAALRGLGEKVTGNKADLIERLAKADPSAQIWDRLQSDYGRANTGKTFLTFDQIAEIRKSAAMIHSHPMLSKCFSGGYPQVSVMWHDEEWDVAMKCRFDYWKPKPVVDLKTFANQMNKPIDRAIAGAMATYKYHIQAGLYMRAADRGVEMMRTGLADCDAETAKRFTSVDPEERGFIFVFQQKGPVPNTRGRIFPRHATHATALSQIAMAAAEYKRHVEHFGDAPWIDLSEITAFADEDFPPWTFE